MVSRPFSVVGSSFLSIDSLASLDGDDIAIEFRLTLSLKIGSDKLLRCHKTIIYFLLLI